MPKDGNKPPRRITFLDPSTRLLRSGLVVSEPSKRQKRKHEQIRGSQARTVRYRGARIKTGAHTMGRLNNKMVASEAGIEKSLWPVVDFMYPTLVDAVSQPFTTTIEVLDKTHKWTPDGLLTLACGRQILIEVKPLSVLQPREGENPFGKRLPEGLDARVYAIALYNAWKEAAADLGLEFLALSEVEIRTEPRFYNAKIWHSARGKMPDDIRASVVEALETGPATLTVADLAKYFGPHWPSGLLLACQLDRGGFIRLDRKDYFSPRTVVTNLCGVHAK